MPPKAKPKPVLARVMIQANNNVWWAGYPAPDWFPYEILAYGWSDGIMTWKETRE